MQKQPRCRIEPDPGLVTEAERITTGANIHTIRKSLIWYQHWWTDNLRSTLSASAGYNHANTILISGCTSCNKLLSMTHANLFWSPVAFVDFAAEYAWGHRVTTQNFKGDANVLMGMMRVRF